MDRNIHFQLFSVQVLVLLQHREHPGEPADHLQRGQHQQVPQPPDERPHARGEVHLQVSLGGVGQGSVVTVQSEGSAHVFLCMIDTTVHCAVQPPTVLHSARIYIRN